MSLLPVSAEPRAVPHASSPPPWGALESCHLLALDWARLHPQAVCGRSADCFVRHLGFYLAHVACGVTQRELARRAACHPSSVAYGIRRIEALRDDARLDRHLARLEALAGGVTGEILQ